ncbi:MAG: PAS domain-containing protein [Chloroflexaceae bacterium]|nr:PAS domain-containing protein [Chloroflexaceae bacterium]
MYTIGPPILAAVVEQARDGIAVADVSGTLIYANRAFQQLMGYNPDAHEMTIYDLFTDEEEADHLMVMVHDMAEYGSWQGDLTHTRLDQVVLKLQLTLVALRDVPDQPPALALFLHRQTAM